MCSVIDQSDVVPGVLCLTVNQTQQLVINPVGSWELLPGIIIGNSYHQGSPTIFYYQKYGLCLYGLFLYALSS